MSYALCTSATKEVWREGKHPPSLYNSDLPQNKLFSYREWSGEIGGGHVLQDPTITPFHRGLSQNNFNAGIAWFFSIWLCDLNKVFKNNFVCNVLGFLKKQTRTKTKPRVLSCGSILLSPWYRSWFGTSKSTVQTSPCWLLPKWQTVMACFHPLWRNIVLGQAWGFTETCRKHNSVTYACQGLCREMGFTGYQ